MRLRTLLVIMCIAVSLIPICIIGGVQGFQLFSMVLISIITGVTFIVSIIMAYLISRPIEKLTNNINEISKGKLDVQLENSEIFEINNLTDSLNRVMTSLKLAINKVGVKRGEIFDEPANATAAVEEKYKELLNNITGWAWEVSPKGVYTYCSKNISNILGYKPEEILGKSIFDFMPPEEAKKIKPIFTDASQKRESIKNLVNWKVRSNGKEICMIKNGVPYFDNTGKFCGYRGVDIDITESKKAQQQIKELNTELTDLKKKITHMLNEYEKKPASKKQGKPSAKRKKLEDKWTEDEFDSVFIFDENANILDCNENMYKRLGYKKGEILSLNISDIDALESKEDIKNKINKAKKSGHINFKTIHKRKDGTSILVNEHMEYLKDKNQFKCIVREDYSMK